MNHYKSFPDFQKSPKESYLNLKSLNQFHQIYLSRREWIKTSIFYFGIYFLQWIFYPSFFSKALEKLDPAKNEVDPNSKTGTSRQIKNENEDKTESNIRTKSNQKGLETVNDPISQKLGPNLENEKNQITAIKSTPKESKITVTSIPEGYHQIPTDDPLALALGYQENSKDKLKRCEKCTRFTKVQKSSWGECSMISTGLVSAFGVCQSFDPKT